LQADCMAMLKNGTDAQLRKIHAAMTKLGMKSAE
jgi:hypothetical protein